MTAPDQGRPEGAAPIFFVSTGRTGTRFFSRLFSEHANGIDAHHITGWTRPLNVLSSMAALRLLPRAVSNAWFRVVKAPGIRAAPGRYLECSNYYFGSIPVIRRCFPAARIVLITRHPRAFVLSQVRWERQRGTSRIANRLVPFWGPVGYHEQLLGLLGDTRQRVRYYARVWTRRNRVMLDDIERDPLAMRIRFEDIFTDPAGIDRLTGLIQWLGIELTASLAPDVLARPLNQTAPDPGLGWEPAYEEILRRECGALMETLGYGP